MKSPTKPRNPYWKTPRSQVIPNKKKDYVPDIPDGELLTDGCDDCAFLGFTCPECVYYGTENNDADSSTN